MPKIMANGVNIHYWQHGRGPDMILVHGLGGNMAVWHMGMLPLLQREYRITAYDARGHGSSDMPPSGYTTGDMVEDLRCLMDELGIAQAYMVGHSMGAETVLHFSLRYPERVRKAVVIEAMFVPLSSLYLETSDSIAWAFLADLFQNFTGFELPPEHQGDIAYLLDRTGDFPIMYGPLKGHKRNTEPLRRLFFDTTFLEEVKMVTDYTVDGVTRITTPILLIYESDSLFMESYRVLHERLPNNEGLVLPYSRLKHALLYEHPEVVVDQIKAFIETNTILSTSTAQAA